MASSNDSREPTNGRSNRDNSTTLRLPFVRPYDWKSILSFLVARAIPGVEWVDGESYYRTFELDGLASTIVVSLDREAANLICAVDVVDSSLLVNIRERVVNLFDLAVDIAFVDKFLFKDEFLAPLIVARPGLRVPGGWDPFEVAIRAVLGQQISVTAARRLAGTLARNHGKPLLVPSKQGTLAYVFPTPEVLARTDDLGLGMPKARLQAIKSIAQRAVEDPNLFVPGDSLEQSLSKLLALRGIGEWTAHYIAMRAMREMDAFPVTDLGIIRGFEAIEKRRPDIRELLGRAEGWRPWRAYAAQHLWAADAANRP